MRSFPRIIVAARDSKLSRRQVEEALAGIDYEPMWVKTTGDHDLKTSLRTLDKTDFFTREIDQLLQRGKCRIAVHSAKDLPDPLASGLVLAALTKGIDPSDVLVFNSLPPNAKVGSSSPRRDAMIKHYRSDLQIVDIRGPIDARLEMIDQGKLDGVVIAEAALIRLNLTHRNRIRLEGEPAPLQGKLAIIARQDDLEILDFFK